jgi:hypothetical protein
MSYREIIASTLTGVIPIQYRIDARTQSIDMSRLNSPRFIAGREQPTTTARRPHSGPPRQRPRFRSTASSWEANGRQLKEAVSDYSMIAS